MLTMQLIGLGVALVFLVLAGAALVTELIADREGPARYRVGGGALVAAVLYGGWAIAATLYRHW